MVCRCAKDGPGVIGEQTKGATDLVQHVVSVFLQDRYALELDTRTIDPVPDIRRHGINPMPQRVEIERALVDTMHDATPQTTTHP
jgi:hypothetical protein